jgi:hypothetical protein
MQKESRKHRPSRRRPPEIIARGSSHPNAIFNLPPKKIIKATMPYQAQGPGELSFAKDDFFYVIDDRPDSKTYEVINPLQKTRGIVHYHCFKSIEKQAEPVDPHHVDEQRYGYGDSREQPRMVSPVSPRYDSHPRSPYDRPPSPAAYDSRMNSIYASEFEFGADFQNDEYQREFAQLPKDRLNEFKNTEGRRMTEYTEMDYGRNEYHSYDRYNDGYNENSRFDNGYEYEDQFDPDDGMNRLASQLQAMGQRRSEDAYPARTSRSSRPNLPPSEIIDVCTVMSADPVGDKYSYTIHVKYVDERLDILHRSHDDIWALQVTLLTKYPLEAGRDSEPRVIPFLNPPSSMTPQQAAKTRFELNRYLTELMQLPSHVLYSPSVSRFFKTRPGDDQNAIVSFDVADTLLDLLEDYQSSNEITIKLVLGSEIVAWKTSEFISHRELKEEVSEKLGFRFQTLLYMDEVENLIPLQGDSDLRLLCALGKIKFYVK